MRFEITVPCWVQHEDLTIPQGVETLFRRFIRVENEAKRGTNGLIDDFVDAYVELYVSILTEPVRHGFVVFKPIGWKMSKDAKDALRYPFDLKDLKEMVRQALEYRLKYIKHDDLFCYPASRRSLQTSLREMLKNQIRWTVACREIHNYALVVGGSLPYFKGFDATFQGYVSKSLSKPSAIVLGLLHVCYLYDLYRGDVAAINDHLDPPNPPRGTYVAMRHELVLTLRVEGSGHARPVQRAKKHSFRACVPYCVERACKDKL